MADYVLMIKYAYVHVDRMCCVLYPYATGACGKYCSLGNRSSFKYTAYRGLACRPVSVHSVAELQLAVPCCTNGVFGSKVQRVRISDRSSSDLHATDDLRLIITSVQASTQNPKITEKYRRKKIPNKSPTSDNKERTKGAHAALSSYRRHTAVCAPI